MYILNKRSSGILLHISSLPSDYGIGDLGKPAYEFVKFLEETAQSYWQILPLNPTGPESSNSPYSNSSAYAGNKLLIDPELLVKYSLLNKKDLEEIPNFKKLFVDYNKVILFKNKLLKKAFDNFKCKKASNKYKKEFEKFCFENDKKWLNDYALFAVFKNYFRPSCIDWSSWPDNIKFRERNSINNLGKLLKDKIEKEKFYQYIFFKQWFMLKKYANSHNIKIIGDMPVYPDFNSADVWVNSIFFKLDRNKNPLFVSGVPPDYFSNTGQLWKTPVYDWEKLKKNDYEWWIKRLDHNFKLFDLTRIDHFRGLVEYWEVKAQAIDASDGKWVKALPDEFFLKLLKHFNELPVIAEDLGVMTPGVQEILNRYNFPGTKVLIFAFNKNFPENPYLPHNYPKNCAAYTGTHDNNPVKGWFKKEAKSYEKKNLSKYLGKAVKAETVHQDFIRLCMLSAANLTIIPLQDILGLDTTSRMNHPSTTRGNWKWRFSSDQLTQTIKDWLCEITKIYGRTGFHF